MKFYVKSQNVKELSPKNFKLMDIGKGHVNIDNNKTNHLVKFYAHWCPHCHNPELKDMLEAFGEKLKDYNIQVSAFNCAQDTEHGDLSEYLGIESYPTLMYKDIHNNKFVKFNGKRDLKSIIEFLVKNKK